MEWLPSFVCVLIVVFSMEKSVKNCLLSTGLLELYVTPFVSQLGAGQQNGIRTESLTEIGYSWQELHNSKHFGKRPESSI